METAEVRQIVEKLINSDWALSTLCFATEKGILEQCSEPRTPAFISEHCGVPITLAECILDILAALNLLTHQGDMFAVDPGLMPLVSMPRKTIFLANLKTSCLQSREFINSARKASVELGWSFIEPEILQSQGWTSSAIIILIFQEVLPKLGDLLSRLQAPSARFLDVGTGVGAISITACRSLPNLHAVGLEPQEAPLAEARLNISAEGLTDRIELRQQYIEEMQDIEAFDLAFFPQSFMPDEVVKTGLSNIWRALRPGGWALVASVCLPGSDLQAATSRLHDTLTGGSMRIPSQLETMMAESNFTSVASYGLSISAIFNIVAGQRPLI